MQLLMEHPVNNYLKTKLDEKSLSGAELSRKLQVDVKTVDGWINRGVLPRTEMRRNVAHQLGCDVGDLWPDQVPKASLQLTEVINVWGHRSDSPKDFWWQFFEGATTNIDILGYAVQFLHEEHANFADLLKMKAESGCQIRIIVADPTCDMAIQRDREEELRGGLIARIRSSLIYFEPIIAVPNIELRLQEFPMYNSIFRFDDDMLVTPHLYHRPGRLAPLFHFHRKVHNGPFMTYATSFDEVFGASRTAKVSYV